MTTALLGWFDLYTCEIILNIGSWIWLLEWRLSGFWVALIIRKALGHNYLALLHSDFI